MTDARVSGAIGIIRQATKPEDPWTAEDIWAGDYEPSEVDRAIADILNAVVGGSLIPAPVGVGEDVAGRNGVYGIVILHGEARRIAGELQDTIESLSTEVARLTAGLSLWIDRAERAEADNARLTERVNVLTDGLQAVMADRPSVQHNGNHNDLIAWKMWRVARAALADASKG